MKKNLLFTLIFAITAISGFAFTSGEINSRALDNFKADYASVKQVTWTLKPTFSIADFELNGKKHAAYYNLEGDFIGSSESISMEELPLRAKRTIAKKYDGYLIKETLKYVSESGQSYLISVEKDNKTTMIKISEQGNVDVLSS